VERWLTRIGLVLCGLVIAVTVVLLGVRVVAGPRTVHHDRCGSAGGDTVCVHDRHTGSIVSRPWMILLGTLSLCAGAIGVALREHEASLSSSLSSS
jgi:hypothetical protein